MLKPLPKPGENTVPDPAPVDCDACGKTVPRRDYAINCVMVVGSPGHPDLPPFQCGHTEHWACSPECWLIVAHACIDEHMHEILKQHRSTVNL